MARPKSKKVNKEQSIDLVKLGVAPEDIKDFQRSIGGGFLMSAEEVKTAYAEYKKAQELNVEEHIELVFLIPKVQGSTDTQGIVYTVWSGTREAFTDPVYMKNVFERAYNNLSGVWKNEPYFTKPKN